MMHMACVVLLQASDAFNTLMLECPSAHSTVTHNIRPLGFRVKLEWGAAIKGTIEGCIRADI